jgi:uncharacterized Zn finger protein (UPF0148 family)
MFEKLLKSLETINEMKVSVPVNSDAEGYLDKECPFGNCEYQFKVLEEDWADKFRDELVFCPYCRHGAPANDFWTKEQVEQARNVALKQVEYKIGEALRDDANNFNRKQSKNGFITLTMKYEGRAWNNYVMPISAQKELEQKITCLECGARYSVLWSAFFCPCCGHNSIDETFENTLKKIEIKLKAVEAIWQLAEMNPDEVQITTRSLIESWLTDIVVAFQRFCEEKYKQQESTEIIKPNAFQNLEIGGNLWKSLLGMTYEDWLTVEDFNRLNTSFQKRHLLQHQEGIVDKKYLQKSGDEKYKEWQRISVNKEDVLEAVRIIRQVIDWIKKKMASLDLNHKKQLWTQ